MEKPIVNLIGQDGNVFNLLSICTKALKTAGLHLQAKEMGEKIFKSNSYDDALMIMQDYCEIQ